MWLPMYLTKGLGYSIIDAGWISSAFQFGGVFGSPIVGYIVDRSSIKYELQSDTNRSWCIVSLFDKNCPFSREKEGKWE